MRPVDYEQKCTPKSYLYSCKIKSSIFIIFISEIQALKGIVFEKLPAKGWDIYNRKLRKRRFKVLKKCHNVRLLVHRGSKSQKD